MQVSHSIGSPMYGTRIRATPSTCDGSTGTRSRFAFASPLVISAPAGSLPTTRCTSNSPGRTGLFTCTTDPVIDRRFTSSASIGTSSTTSPGRTPGSIDPLVIIAARQPNATGATAQKSRPATAVRTDRRTAARTVDRLGGCSRIPVRDDRRGAAAAAR
jgi:hypothetical protein